MATRIQPGPSQLSTGYNTWAAVPIHSWRTWLECSLAPLLESSDTATPALLPPRCPIHGSCQKTSCTTISRHAAAHELLHSVTARCAACCRATTVACRHTVGYQHNTSTSTTLPRVTRRMVRPLIFARCAIAAPTYAAIPSKPDPHRMRCHLLLRSHCMPHATGVPPAAARALYNHRRRIRHVVQCHVPRPRVTSCCATCCCASGAVPPPPHPPRRPPRYGRCRCRSLAPGPGTRLLVQSKREPLTAGYAGATAM